MLWGNLGLWYLNCANFKNQYFQNKGKSSELSILSDLHKYSYTSVFATIKGSDLAHPDEPDAFGKKTFIYKAILL